MRIHGYKGQVMADPTGGATAVAIASVNEWTLDMSKDTVDVTAFQDENKVFVLGLKSIEGTIGAWYDSSDLTLFEMADADIPALLKLIPDTRQPTFFWTGLAYLDASINVSATGAVSVSGKFVAAGPWTREPVVLRRTPESGLGENVGEALPGRGMIPIAGVRAVLEWGYYRAAAIEGYTIARDTAGGVVWASGTIVAADAFKCTQRPLTFVALIKGGEWRWPLLEPVPALGVGPFTVRLGLQERSAYVVPSRPS